MEKENFNQLFLKNSINETEQKELDAVIAQYPYAYIPKLIKGFFLPNKEKQNQHPLVSELALTTPSNFWLWIKLQAECLADEHIDTNIFTTKAESLASETVQTFEVEVERVEIQDYVVVESVEEMGDEKAGNVFEINIPSFNKPKSDAKTQQKNSFIDWLDLTKNASIQRAEVQNNKKSEPAVSETLAEIYEKQGYTDDAINAYKELSLIFPEKSSYFAERIKKLK